MRHEDARARRAAALYIALKGATSLFSALVYTVELIYQIQTVGLNPLQLVLAGTLQQIVVFLLQAPTGALADVFSRRLAIVLGLLLIGVGFLLEGALPLLLSVLVAQALYGLGTTLVDGADAAWIADEIGARHAGPVYLRATQIGWLATLPGIGLSAALGSVRLALPILLGGCLFATLAIVLALVMPEHHIAPAPRRARPLWRELQRTVWEGARAIRGSEVLRTVLAVAALFGIFDAAFGRLWQYHLLHSFSFPTFGGLAPVVWFGIIEAAIALSSIAGLELARRTVNTNSHRAVALALGVVAGLIAGGALGFAVAGQFALALAALWLITMAHGPRIPLETAWMNHQVETPVRATVFSLRGQIEALAAIAGGPILGALASAAGTRTGLLVAGLVISLALPLYLRTLHREKGARGDMAANVSESGGTGAGITRPSTTSE